MIAITQAMPSIVTLGSLFCGLLSAMNALEGNLVTAAWLIIAAGILDALDGKVSRMFKAASRFGVEFDSIADVCSFGFAPAVLFYQFLTQPHLHGVATPFEPVAFALSFIFLACGAIRLARFNVQLVGFTKNAFTGVPIPMGAGALASFIVFMNAGIMDGVDLEWVFPFLELAVAGLMVSTFKYDTLPRLAWSGPANRVRLLLLLAWMVFAAFFPAEAFFPLGIAYLASGVVRGIAHAVRGEEEAALDEAALETSDGEEAIA